MLIRIEERVFMVQYVYENGSFKILFLDRNFFERIGVCLSCYFRTRNMENV